MEVYPGVVLAKSWKPMVGFFVAALVLGYLARTGGWSRPVVYVTTLALVAVAVVALVPRLVNPQGAAAVRELRRLRFLHRHRNDPRVRDSLSSGQRRGGDRGRSAVSADQLPGRLGA